MTVILSTSFRHNRNNRWSGISENTHLHVWQNQGTLHLTKITSLRNHSRHANHIHKTKCCTSNPAPDPPFLWPPHTLYNLFMNQVENILPSSPSSRGIKRNQTKISKVGFAILKCGFMRTKKKKKNPSISEESRHLQEFLHVCTMVGQELLHLRRHVSVI